MFWAEDDTDRGDSGSIYIPASDRSRLSTMQGPALRRPRRVKDWSGNRFVVSSSAIHESGWGKLDKKAPPGVRPVPEGRPDTGELRRNGAEPGGARHFSFPFTYLTFADGVLFPLLFPPAHIFCAQGNMEGRRNFGKKEMSRNLVRVANKIPFMTKFVLHFLKQLLLIAIHLWRCCT